MIDIDKALLVFEKKDPNVMIISISTELNTSNQDITITNISYK